MHQPIIYRLYLAIVLVLFSFAFAYSQAKLTKWKFHTKVKLISSAFKEGEFIPRKYTCDGNDISPTIQWDSIPKRTKSIALICDDPDAPMGTWVHWVLYNIPQTMKELPEGISQKTLDSLGIKQGTNDFHHRTFGGPCPPKGKPHHYYFKLYALDIMLSLKEGATKIELLVAMKNHVAAEGQLIGIYQRQ